MVDRTRKSQGPASYDASLMREGFIHLRSLSSYSLAEGAIKISEDKPKDGSKPVRASLIDLTKSNAMPAVAVTDHGNLFGALEFAVAATEAGIQPIIGCVLPLLREGSTGKTSLPVLDALPVLVMDATGYRNLVALVSHSFMAPDRLHPYVTWDELADKSSGLLALTGGLNGPLAALLSAGQNDAALACLKTLQRLFPQRLYIELQRHDEGVIGTTQQRLEPLLLDLAYAHDLPLVATNDVQFGVPEMYEAHDALLAIADKSVLADEKRRRLTTQHYFKSAAEMRELFADLPEACNNSLVIAQRCAYWPQQRQPILPAFPTTAGRSEADEIRFAANAGLDERITALGLTSEAAAPYRQRLEFELEVIVKMGFSGYFLIVSDFIKYAKANRIPVGPGRGSGAGSVVAWALTITDLDPLHFGLLFERFLNPERVSMPDFDIDFCQERRDEVIAYVQKKYGHDRVAQIITFGKLQARAVLRDVGRVMAMPYGYVDKICKLVPNNPANPVSLAQALASEPALQALRREDAAVEQMMDIALKLEGLYRNASTHAAGVVIGDSALTEIVPLYREAGGCMPATQFNMKMVEQAGLVKFDFLGLKTLDVLQATVDMLAERGVTVDLTRLPLDDPKTYALLTRGDTTGVFQFESAGMRDMLRKLKPNRFEDIIAMGALYRPGPMENIPKYIRVKHGQEPPDYLHPLLEPVLKETLGIIIYQEQVMQAAQLLAGYSLGAADLLRRAMGKKKKEEMEAQRAAFVKGATARGVEPDQATRIFEQIDKFAGYGFNKSHAAAYACITYQTAWLKASYPTEFYAATLNFERGDTDKLNLIRQEMERQGIRLLPPDINTSRAHFTVATAAEGERSIRYALAALRGVGDAAMKQLVQERDAHGPFRDPFDFAARLDSKILNKKQMESLIAAGAFDSLSPQRAQLQASIDILAKYGQSQQSAAQTGQGGLFGQDTVAVTQPPLPATAPWDDLTRLQKEFDAVGFYLSSHPLASYAGFLQRLGVVASTEVARHLQTATSNRLKLAGIVLGRQERTAKSGNRFAFLQLSDSAGGYEVTIFSELLAASRADLEVGAMLLLEVEAQKGDDLRFIARSTEPLAKAAARLGIGMRVALRHESALQSLHKILQTTPKGSGKLQLLLTLPDGTEADMALNGGWQLNEEVKTALRKLPAGTVAQEL
jgi:DNA polymerase III subunit alpha